MSSDKSNQTHIKIICFLSLSHLTERVHVTFFFTFWAKSIVFYSHCKQRFCRIRCPDVTLMCYFCGWVGFVCFYNSQAFVFQVYNIAYIIPRVPSLYYRIHTTPNKTLSKTVYSKFIYILYY